MRSCDFSWSSNITWGNCCVLGSSFSHFPWWHLQTCSTFPQNYLVCLYFKGNQRLHRWIIIIQGLRRELLVSSATFTCFSSFVIFVVLFMCQWSRCWIYRGRNASLLVSSTWLAKCYCRGMVGFSVLTE